MSVRLSQLPPPEARPEDKKIQPTPEINFSSISPTSSPTRVLVLYVHQYEVLPSTTFMTHTEIDVPEPLAGLWARSASACARHCNISILNALALLGDILRGGISFFLLPEKIWGSSFEYPYIS